METVNNFFSLISEKTKDFVGREWVFDEIDNWLEDAYSENKKKYFIITGKAGSGKNTISARLIEISNRAAERNGVNDNNGDQDVTSHFKNIKKGFLDASYVISFKDNDSPDPKTLSKSLSSQLASRYEGFKTELTNSIRTSNFYNIDVNASQQQIQAQTVSGGSININIHGSDNALSVFKDLVRTPLELFLKKNPKKKMVFLIDGLDESIVSSKEASSDPNSIVSILSKLEALENVYFIMTTRDYENILGEFREKSSILDISSEEFKDDIEDDISSYIQLNVNKKEFLEKYQNKFDRGIIGKLVEKAKRMNRNANMARTKHAN